MHVDLLLGAYFGYELMGDIASTLVKQGQDVQLHLHPCWQYFKNRNWKEELKTNPPNDDIANRTLDQIEMILTEGLQVFSQWGLPSPKAIRTGGLCVNRAVYKAMNKRGIKFASNIGVGIYPPAESDLILYSGYHQIENCIEIPVLTYCDVKLFSKEHLKLLTITGCCWNEIEYLLIEARRQQLDYVVILTHPSEFVKNQDDQYTDFHPNNINKIRLDKLCKFLQSNRDTFPTTTFSCLDVEIFTDNTPNKLLKVPHLSTLKRLFENYANDRISSL